MIYAIMMYMLGSIFGFFQQNIQYIIPWWKNRELLAAVMFSIPIGYFYLVAWTYFTNEFGSVWSTRFLFFGFSYIAFPFLAYVFLNESPFTLKTFICTMLSILIIAIQYKM
tara:strand:+ start:3614 stop:3946 length:333 start_codon:yes stop_codon:yes gene_type:complete